jgi:hypothetical protein
MTFGVQLGRRPWQQPTMPAHKNFLKGKSMLEISSLEISLYVLYCFLLMLLKWLFNGDKYEQQAQRVEIRLRNIVEERRRRENSQTV